jgi:uncharacterized protein (TIGR03086 family)
MSTEGLERAQAVTRAILANVKPDQLDDDTPCQSWKVRNLITHVVGANYWFAESMNAGASPENDTTEDTDFAAGDFVATYDDAAKQAVAAFGAPGALDKNVKLPFGEFPASAFLGLATSDVFVHGWDLAKATGQDTDLDPELAGQLLAGARASIPDQFRGPDGVAPFGPEVQAPADASVASQLAAFLGRRV